MTGASKIINNGLTDWNQDVGTSHPNTERSTNLFVYNVNELPACSKPAQKKTTKHVKMTITAVRCFSFFVNGVSPTDGCPAAVCKSRVGFLPILPRKRFDSVVNKICPMIIPIEAAKKP
ncbi:Uncharacterised protein [Streptococcus pneumoniae]|nr:Uncharacterised protein [Streptococcus pneumoniae]